MKRPVGIKLIALVLAILLLPIAETALAYGVYEDSARDAVPEDGELSALAQAMNAHGCMLEYENDSFNPWVPTFFDGAPAGRSTYDEMPPYSYISTTFYMDADEELYFEYYVDTAYRNSYLDVHAEKDGMSCCILSNYGGDFAWSSYCFRALRSGTYTIQFDYLIEEPDESGATGNCVYIRNVDLRQKVTDPWIDQAVNAPGCTLEYFGSGHYEWDPTAFDGAPAGVSTNSSEQDLQTESSLYFPVIEFEPGDTLTIEYYVDCDYDYYFQSGYGWLELEINGLLTGDDLAVVHPEDYCTWKTYTYTSEIHKLVSFRLYYFQRAYSPGFNNCAYVRNISCTAAYEESTPTPTTDPTQTPGPIVGSGDVNGDGIVDVSDALLTMRSAMGLTELDPTQLTEADVNGDGTVDVSDALIIMRKAMGLIDN